MPKPSNRNNSRGKGAKKPAPRGAHGEDTVRRCEWPNAAGKPCRVAILTVNGRCARHASQVPPRPEGAPAGNQHARKHGLFSPSLGPAGLVAYETAEEMAADILARDAANFALAKVAEAYAYTPEVRGVVAQVEDFLEQLVQAEELSFEGKAFIMRRLTEPDIASLGKALAPIKGLLEVKKAKGGPGGPSPLANLAAVIKRSQERRDAAGG